MGAASSIGPLGAGFSFTDPRFLALTGAIAGTLLVGALVVALVDRWRKKQMNDTFNAQDELSAYRELYRSGELSAEEYEKVRTRLADRIKAKPKPVVVLDPDTGMPIVLKNPTAPVVSKEPEAPPPPPQVPPTS